MLCVTLLDLLGKELLLMQFIFSVPGDGIAHVQEFRHLIRIIQLVHGTADLWVLAKVQQTLS